MEAPTLRLVLEIDQPEPIAGRLNVGSASRSFSGWLELAAALQAALDDPPVPREMGHDRPRTR